MLATGVRSAVGRVAGARVRLAAVAAAAFYFALCPIMLAPICNFAHLGSASYEGDARLVVWILAWDNHVVLDHVRGWFDANTFYPAPNGLAYAEHLFGISLFTLPVYWLTRNPVLAYNLAWLASFVLSACAAHALAWRYTRDHAASLAAGVAYGFCFFRMHHAAGHLQILWSFWIPVWLIAVDRWIERPSWARCAVVVVVAGLQALASWYQAVMIAVAGVPFGAWALITDKSVRFGTPEGRRRGRLLMVQGVVGAAASLAIVWPFARHYLTLPGGGPREALANSADLAGFLVPPENTFAGQWLLSHGVKGPRWIWGELTVYVGWTPLLLAVAGAVIAIRRRTSGARRARFFVLLGAVAVALALGPSASAATDGRWGLMPFGLLARVPALELFRVPARFAELVTLAVAVLAAVACAAIGQQRRRAELATLVVALPLMLAESYVVRFPGGQPQPFPVPAVYRQLATLPGGAVVSLPDFANTPLWFREADYQYFSTAHWHPIVNGYARVPPAGYERLIARLSSFPSDDSLQTLRMSGVSYVVLHAANLAGVSRDAPARAMATPGVHLVAQSRDDYLFSIR